MIQPIPIQRYLVPERRPTTPDGFTHVDERLVSGLPHRIQLDPEFTLILLVPSGLAITWRDIDPLTLVSSSNIELTPGQGNPTRAPARILVQRGGNIIASVPLVVGLKRIIPENSPNPGARLDLLILSWDLRSGNLRGPGDFGGKISLAWGRAEQAVNQFSISALNPSINPEDN